jgi:cell division inhibitor SulA/protein ImuA
MNKDFTARYESPTTASRDAVLNSKVFRIGDIGGASSGHGLQNGNVLPTGFAALDAQLNGGWQRPGLTEILCDHTGVGELSLLIRALSSATCTSLPDDEQHFMWVLAPGQPWIPYAPALAQCGISLECLAIVRTNSNDDALWAAEQGLKSGACRCVLLRLNETYCSSLSLRRLLQASIAGGSMALLLRPLTAASSPSPAATRIALHPEKGGALRVELLKRRGLPPGKSVRVAARGLACLQREPAIVRANKLTKSDAFTRPDWLENVVSGTASNQVKPRAHLLDPNRR